MGSNDNTCDLKTQVSKEMNKYVHYGIFFKLGSEDLEAN